MTPIRTCVGCGATAPQADLVRFVADAGTLRLDVARRAPGRGAWLHRRRGPVRSLRRTPDRAQRERLVQMLETQADC